MATTHSIQVHTKNGTIHARGVLLLTAYASVVMLTIGLATATAAVLASFSAGLGQFILVAAGWLAVVSASPALARRATVYLDSNEFGRRIPRASRAVTAALTYGLGRRPQPAGRQSSSRTID